jgi:hypothetical protein
LSFRPSPPKTRAGRRQIRGPQFVIDLAGGTTFDATSSLTTLVNSYQPGDKITMAWIDSYVRSQTTTTVQETSPAA